MINKNIIPALWRFTEGNKPHVINDIKLTNCVGAEWEQAQKGQRLTEVKRVGGLPSGSECEVEA